MNADVSVAVSAIDRVTAPLRQISKRFEMMGRDAKRAMEEAASTAKRIGAVVVGLSAAFATVAIRSRGDMQTALGEIESVGVANLEAVRKAARLFSQEWSGTTAPEFVKAAYAIKSGISNLSDEGVAEYTRIAGVTAKATKASTEQMTSLFATGYGIFKKQFAAASDMEFGQIFSAGIAESVKAYKTDGANMQQAIERVGDAGVAANVPLKEQLSILGMLQQTSASGSEAGTKYVAFLEKAAKAGQELGLPFLDAKKQLKSMPEVLKLIKAKYGDTIDAMEQQELAKAFGTQESVKAIMALIDRTDELSGNIGGMDKALHGGMATTEAMARAMNKGPNEAFQLLTQRIGNFTESVGKALESVLAPLINKISDMVKAVGDWAEAHPELTRVIIAGVAGLGALVAALGVATAAYMAWNSATITASGVVVKWLLSSLSGAVTGLWGFTVALLRGVAIALLAATQSIITFASSLATTLRQALVKAAVSAWGFVTSLISALVPAITGAVAAVWSFTAALLANPITWIVLGIAALVAGIVLLWKNWDTVSGALKASWEWLKGAFASFSNAISAGIQWLRDAITNVLGGAWDGVAAAWTDNPLVQAVTGIVTAVWDALKAGWDRVTAWFGGAWAKLKGMIPDVALHAMGLTTNEEDAVAERQKMKASSSFAQQFPQRPAAKEFMTAGQSLPSAAAALPGAAGGKSETKVAVEFVNAPKGTRIKDIDRKGNFPADVSMGLTMAPDF
ncbi:phage tail tape measure protein [Desulfarculus baarsii]